MNDHAEASNDPNETQNLGPILNAHSCDFCQVQEIDPGSKVDKFEKHMDTALVRIRYRGSRIVDGASKGCTFFAHCLEVLQPFMKLKDYEDGSNSTNFNPPNWVYNINFATGGSPRIFRTGYAFWTCAPSELRGHTIDPNCRRYLVVASHGKCLVQVGLRTKEAYV